jgi:phosphate transport system substrate-binding protein
MALWQDQFNQLDAGDVAYSSMTSPSGLSAFSGATADVALSDLTYAASGLTPPGQPFQYVPVAEAGEGFQYNLVGVNGKQINNLVLTPHTIGDIFLGVITKWNDPALEALNPGRGLPNANIKAFYQSEPSSDSYVLSDYLNAEDPTRFDSYLSAIGATVGSQPAAVWPAPMAGQVPTGFPNWGTGHIQAVSSANAAMQAPIHTKDSISYALGPMKPHRVGLPMAFVVNASNQVAGAKYANVATALSSLTPSQVLDDDLVPAFASTLPQAYPLSTYSYFLAACSPSLAAGENPPTTCSGDNSGTSSFSAAKGAELGAFIDYVACQGQASMNGLGYGVLPATMVEIDFADIGAINGATEPSSC